MRRCMHLSCVVVSFRLGHRRAVQSSIDGVSHGIEGWHYLPIDLIQSIENLQKATLHYFFCPIRCGMAKPT